MNREESKAHALCWRRFRQSPEVLDAIEALRTRAELDRARRAAQRRKRVLLALEVVAGVLAAALTLALAFGFMLELAR